MPKYYVRCGDARAIVDRGSAQEAAMTIAKKVKDNFILAGIPLELGIKIMPETEFISVNEIGFDSPIDTNGIFETMRIAGL
jgi:hypothetical protein